MVLPFEYWPCLSWMKQLLNGKDVQLEQWGTYQKQSLTNRCKISGDKGIITLSIPLIGGREQKTFLKDVRIDHSQRWAVQHLRSLKSCYGKAPFFDHYFPKIENILFQKQEWLLDVDQTILQHLLQWFRKQQEVRLTDSFHSLPQQAHTNHFNPPPYLQVFSDKQAFIPNLSVLDALFCLGPAVPEYLQSEAT